MSANVRTRPVSRASSGSRPTSRSPAVPSRSASQNRLSTGRLNPPLTRKESPAAGSLRESPSSIRRGFSVGTVRNATVARMGNGGGQQVTSPQIHHRPASVRSVHSGRAVRRIEEVLSRANNAGLPQQDQGAARLRALRQSGGSPQTHKPSDSPTQPQRGHTLPPEQHQSVASPTPAHQPAPRPHPAQSTIDELDAKLDMWIENIASRKGVMADLIGTPPATSSGLLFAKDNSGNSQSTASPSSTPTLPPRPPTTSPKQTTSRVGLVRTRSRSMSPSGEGRPTRHDLKTLNQRTPRTPRSAQAQRASVETVQSQDTSLGPMQSQRTSVETVQSQRTSVETTMSPMAGVRVRSYTVDDASHAQDPGQTNNRLVAAIRASMRISHTEPNQQTPRSRPRPMTAQQLLSQSPQSGVNTSPAPRFNTAAHTPRSGRRATEPTPRAPSAESNQPHSTPREPVAFVDGSPPPSPTMPPGSPPNTSTSDHQTPTAASLALYQDTNPLPARQFTSLRAGTEESITHTLRFADELMALRARARESLSAIRRVKSVGSSINTSASEEVRV